MYNQIVCEKALTRTARKAFRKSGLDQTFITNCYVWFRSGDRNATIGNFILFSGKFSHKDENRLRSILPHVLKVLRKTARACGHKGDFVLDEFLAAYF